MDDLQFFDRRIAQLSQRRLSARTKKESLLEAWFTACLRLSVAGTSIESIKSAIAFIEASHAYKRNTLDLKFQPAANAPEMDALMVVRCSLS